MQLSERDIDVIDAFLFGSMTSDDQLYFEARLSDEEFSTYLSQQKELFNTIEEKGRSQTKRKLESIERSLASKNIKPLSSQVSISTFFNRRTILAIAAGIILILSFIGGSKLLSNNKSQNLYASYYAPYPNLIDPITKGSSQDKSPYQYYEAKQYDKAVDALLVLPESNDRNWHLAQSYIATEKVIKAIGLLTPIANSLNNEYREAAQWYLALLLMKEKQIDDAKVALSNIAASSEHPYAVAAKDLLREI